MSVWIALGGNVDKACMDREKGLFGAMAFQNCRIAVDGWELHRPSHTVLICCDGGKFAAALGLTIPTLAKVIGQEWQVRCDNDDHIYYGYAKCTGLSLPAKAVKSPVKEYFPNDLVLHFEFHHRCYGPYHVAEGKAMARNGNDLFFDLLELAEIDHRIAVGDLRFKYKSANTD